VAGAVPIAIEKAIHYNIRLIYQPEGITGLESRIKKEIAEAIREVALDNVHCASFICRRCIEILGRAAQAWKGPEGKSLWNYLVKVGRALAQAQPAMAAPANRIAGLLDTVSRRQGRDATRSRVAGEVEYCLSRHDSELERLGEAGAVLLAEKFREPARIVTLSYSAAVYAILSRLAPDTQTRITVAESRPLCEGVRLAEKLAGEGFTVEVVTDAMLGIETAGASCVLVGADTVLPDGALINKAGTRLAALAAKLDNVPLYCCTPTGKVLPSAEGEKTADRVFQREGDPAELFAGSAAGVKARNLYFDRTEYFLLNGFITERGFIRGREIINLSRELAEVRDRVFGIQAGD